MQKVTCQGGIDIYINPKIVLENGWIEGEITNDQIQPNGIDVRLKEVREVLTLDEAYLLEDERQILYRKPLELVNKIIKGKERQVYELVSPKYYELMIAERIRVPENVGVHIYLRSSVVRSGCVKSVGFFDSGFEGHSSTYAHQVIGKFNIEPNVRFAQALFVEAPCVKCYSGVYNNVNVS